MKNDCVVVWNEVTNEIVWFAEDDECANKYISSHATPDILYKARGEYPTYEKAIAAWNWGRMKGENLPNFDLPL